MPCSKGRAFHFVEDLTPMERKTDQYGSVYWQCLKCGWASKPLPPEEQQKTPPPHQCTGRKSDTWF